MFCTPNEMYTMERISHLLTLYLILCWCWMLNWSVSTFKIQMAYFQIESLSIASGHLPVPHIGAMQILSKCIMHNFSTGNILIPLEIPTKHCTFFLMCIRATQYIVSASIFTSHRNTNCTKTNFSNIRQPKCITISTNTFYQKIPCYSSLHF